MKSPAALTPPAFSPLSGITAEEKRAATVANAAELAASNPAHAERITQTLLRSLSQKPVCVRVRP